MWNLLQWINSLLSKKYKYQKRFHNGLSLEHQTAHYSPILDLFSTIAYHFLSYTGSLTMERFLSFQGTQYQKRPCNRLFLGQKMVNNGSKKTVTSYIHQLLYLTTVWLIAKILLQWKILPVMVYTAVTFVCWNFKWPKGYITKWVCYCHYFFHY